MDELIRLSPISQLGSYHSDGSYQKAVAAILDQAEPCCLRPQQCQSQLCAPHQMLGHCSMPIVCSTIPETAHLKTDGYYARSIFILAKRCDLLNSLDVPVAILKKSI